MILVLLRLFDARATHTHKMNKITPEQITEHYVIYANIPLTIGNIYLFVRVCEIIILVSVAILKKKTWKK